MKEKYLKLVDMIAEDKENGDFYLKALESCLADFDSYVTSIYNMEVLIPIQRHRLEGDELRAYITNLDGRRKACHNAAIASINMINRIAKAVGAEPLYDREIDRDNLVDRRQAANFCAKFVMAIIYDQVSTGIDDTVAFLTKTRNAG